MESKQCGLCLDIAPCFGGPAIRMDSQLSLALDSAFPLSRPAKRGTPSPSEGGGMKGG